MNRETKLQIFQHYPEVYEAFKAEEGKKKMEREFWEKEFWEKYFRTYIVEDQRPLEDGIAYRISLDTRYELICKIQKEDRFDTPYPMLHFSLSETPKNPPSQLYISVDDCSNAPADRHANTYEPQINDGTPTFPMYRRRIPRTALRPNHHQTQ